MSVLIKGMDMPKNCDECFFVGRGFPDWCSLPQIQKDEDEIDDTNNRPDWCPLEALPSTQPKLNKEKISDLLWNEYQEMSSHLSTEGVIARRYFCKELWKELFGEEETPVWMTW